MNRSLAILIFGLAAGSLGYWGVYHAGTAAHSALARSPSPELAWLKEEFHLSDPEFARLARMHDDYLSGCGERCRLIDAKNHKLRELLAASDHVTPEIESLLKAAAELRADCQKQMLQHFYDVSRAMPPDQGKRYLAWVHRQTVLPDTHSSMHH